ncbi:uncharacterized protein K452DRAFT_45822 [Aplosporella prunicola CBS 121167]|uniref:F-box domain-containing protein n=1 Tax=Aplosporella prunicola CBS 121167 TaxID=1176127 RepID=A0A6A6BCX0_9PEZI|nr:uncharacterized protein K452DRAFT_45822 [Aplosporella prunicola CBS 121167]KAF2141135.1 hypothetical protein K452DRAFT_45822 [Aplosporella prunicola CBS 121167]
MPPPVLNLPKDVFLCILENLDFPAIFFLKMTCKPFYHFFIPITPPFTDNMLREAEAHPVFKQRNLHACFDCHRLRPASAFGDKMLLPKEQKGVLPPQFCWDCGLDPPPGALVKNLILTVFCINCGEPKSRMHLEDGSPTMFCKECFYAVLPRCEEQGISPQVRRAMIETRYGAE